MKRALMWGAVVLGLAALTPAYAGDKPAGAGTPGKCTFKDTTAMKKHAGEHIKFPAKGAAVKAACKKEWPDEFTKEEWACFDASVKDDQEYKSADDVLKAVGVK
jgi:hypothetical protein